VRGAGEPAHATAAIDPAPGAGLVRAVGPGGPLSVGVEGACLDVARLGAGEVLALPAGARVHAYITTGALLRFSLAEPLSAGDTLCLTDTTSYDVQASVPTEVLVWSLP
jgi:hypothetical protein